MFLPCEVIVPRACDLVPLTLSILTTVSSPDEIVTLSLPPGSALNFMNDSSKLDYNNSRRSQIRYSHTIPNDRVHAEECIIRWFHCVNTTHASLCGKCQEGQRFANGWECTPNW